MENNNLVWNYTMDTKKRAEMLSKRFLNKRYLDKQIKIIEAYRRDLNDLKVVMQNMYLVDNIEMERIQVLQANLKDKNCVKAFVNQFSKFGRFGFTPYIAGDVV